MADTPKTEPVDSQRGHPPSPASAPPSRTLFSLSEEETFEFGRTLGRGLEGGEVILLEGDLGLGKTVFARGIAAGLGIAPEDVNSPSFTLVQEYRGGRLRMYHVDLYRMDSVEDLSTLGLDEILSAGGVTVVEWGEKLPAYLGGSPITVRLHDVGEGSRRIELVDLGNGSVQRRGDA